MQFSFQYSFGSIPITYTGSNATPIVSTNAIKNPSGEFLVAPDGSTAIIHPNND